MARDRLGKEKGGNGKHGRNGTRAREAEPILNQKSREIQKYGELIHMPIGLDEDARAKSVKAPCAAQPPLRGLPAI